MANLLNRFNRTSVGSANKDIDYDDYIASNGDFRKTEGLNTIIRSWKTILTTSLRTYDHDPEFGSELKEYIFETADDQTKEEIASEVENSLMRFDDRAEIQDIKVTFLNNMKGFVLDIVISYEGEEVSINEQMDETLVG